MGLALSISGFKVVTLPLAGMMPGQKIFTI
jgi:hypothetical protein